MLGRLKGKNISEEEIAKHSVFIVEEIKRNRFRWVLEKSEEIFKNKLKAGDIFLKLIATPYENLNWVLPEKINVFAQENEPPIAYEKNVFTPQFASLYNNYERQVATYINQAEAVKWWHRLGVKGTEYHVQGWKRDKIYPDFLIKLQNDDGGVKFQFIEPKGEHLKGNDDSKYKQEVFAYLNKIAENDINIVGDFTLLENQHQLNFEMIFEADWQNQLNKIL